MSARVERIAKIEDALDRLVTQALFEEFRLDQIGRTYRIYNRNDLEHTEEIELNRLLDCPIGKACRLAMREFGQHLLRITGTIETLSEVLDRVASRDPRQWSCRLDILGWQWDGLEIGGNKWWMD